VYARDILRVVVGGETWRMRAAKCRLVCEVCCGCAAACRGAATDTRIGVIDRDECRAGMRGMDIVLFCERCLVVM
jgi:hypothetical protein